MIIIPVMSFVAPIKGLMHFSTFHFSCSFMAMVQVVGVIFDFLKKPK